MPGVSVTVAEQIAALRVVSGDKAAALIKAEPDEAITRIVAGWPQTFDANRARGLGFAADASFEAIIRAHIEDEHGGTAPIQA
jgi:acetyl-CoA acetyltransferase